MSSTSDFISSYSNSQDQEAAYFNWQCVICNLVAQSPLELEQQHMVYEFSVYTDIDGTKWVKCDECMSPFHLECGTDEPECVVIHKRFVCTYFNCKQ